MGEPRGEKLLIRSIGLPEWAAAIAEQTSPPGAVSPNCTSLVLSRAFRDPCPGSCDPLQEENLANASTWLPLDYRRTESRLAPILYGNLLCRFPVLLADAPVVPAIRSGANGEALRAGGRANVSRRMVSRVVAGRLGLLSPRG